MRVAQNEQMDIGEVDVSNIAFDFKSRDDIPKILRGLQFVYNNLPLRTSSYCVQGQPDSAQRATWLGSVAQKRQTEQTSARRRACASICQSTPRPLSGGVGYQRFGGAWPRCVPRSWHQGHQGLQALCRAGRRNPQHSPHWCHCVATRRAARAAQKQTCRPGQPTQARGVENARQISFLSSAEQGSWMKRGRNLIKLWLLLGQAKFVLKDGQKTPRVSPICLNFRQENC